MFPTTIWTTINRAGARDPAALESFAARYRGAVLEHLRSQGARPADAEDLCQDVFLRVFSGGVLAGADPTRGRFRSLLRTITRRVLIDHHRRRGTAELEGDDPASAEEGFDQTWAWHLTERALERLRETSPAHHDVLRGHLADRPQERRRLWQARRRLATLVRAEVAETTSSREDLEEELRHLAPFLGSRPKKPGKAATEATTDRTEDGAS